MKRSILACCAASILLAGCAGPSYWHEPPAAASGSGEPDIWQGLVRNGTLHYFSRDRLMHAISVRCASYTDLVSLTREGDRVEISLGSDPALEFDTGIDADGRFSLVQPVEGDTWVYGGVMLFDDAPELHLWGQLDEVTGLGEGRVNVSPGDERLGCVGYFQVSRNGGSPDESERGSAFKVRYWIDEVDSFDNPWFSGLPPRPFPHFWRY
ncbi:hypothetical protein [Marinobacterium lutimaris]|uniref:Outer membrane lipoprotein n=1 Tax=Marinobacterium lutimaris TaxID=568106 RepID=A0A1H6DN82_9GAMM|nr:hypothetical protein [Marinobacterium lutimaris]SEG86213.1 hypothetical protein SAMN05444390_107147 [Marinobacterium lutimaris]